MPEPGYDPFQADQNPPNDDYVPSSWDDRQDYTQDADSDSVPVGSAREVLDWVDGDKDRAQTALDAEESKGDSQRKGLTRDLQEIISK